MKTGIETGAYFGDRLTAEGLALVKVHGYDCLDYQFLADTNWEGYALQGQAFDTFFREEARRVQAAGLEICQTANLQNAVFRHGGVPHQIAPGLHIVDIL